jgi:hypothetical protein
MTIKHSILFALLGLSTFVSAQQPIKTDTTASDSIKGIVIQYDITRRVDGQNIKIVIIGGSGDQGGGPEAPPTITIGQSASLSELGAMMGEPQMPMPKLPPGVDEEQEGVQIERMIIRPTEEQSFMDMKKRQFVRVMSSKFDPEHKTYYSTEALTTPKDWKESKKTKKIAGITCKKATCTIDNLEYTVWFTTELPGTFSPKAHIFPTAGVVLGIESDEESYEATAVTRDVMVVKPATVPANAELMTPDAMMAKRREFAQKAAPPGGMMRRPGGN